MDLVVTKPYSLWCTWSPPDFTWLNKRFRSVGQFRLLDEICYLCRRHAI